MSWGLIINNVFLSRINKSELTSKKEEYDELLRMIENKLVAIGSYTSDIVIEENEEQESIIDYSSRVVPQLLTEYSEILRSLQLVNIAINSNDEDVKEDK